MIKGRGYLGLMQLGLAELYDFIKMFCDHICNWCENTLTVYNPYNNFWYCPNPNCLEEMRKREKQH